jgi:hypothetical protein
MDEQKPREADGAPRDRHASDDERIEPHYDLSKRRELHRTALTERERAERWPCG